MANVTVSVPVSNVSVSTTNSIVSVGTTTSNIIVSSSALLSNADVRAAISVVDAGGDGSLAYDQANGVITYTGPSASEVRTHFSAVSPATYSSATGVIGVDSSAVFASQTTDNLTEGSSNLYYTTARFNSAFGTKTTDDLPEGATNKYFSTTLANSAIAAYTGSMSNMTGNVVTTANISGADLIASSNITATGNISATHGTFTGATSVTATGNVSIGGNLNVTGNINSETVVDLFVEDRNITLQYGAVGAPSANSQIFVDRGSSANTYILWNEGTDRWNFSNDGSTEFVLPTSTTDIAEGTNLYLNGAGTTDNLTEGTTNLYYSNARVLAGVTAGNVKLKHYSETEVFIDPSTGNTTGNITLDYAEGSTFRVPVTGNITGISFANATLGSSATILFNNDGGHSLDTTTHASNWSDWYFADNIKSITGGGSSGFPASVMTVIQSYKTGAPPTYNFLASIVDVGEDAGAVPGAIQGNITLNTNETTDQDAYIFANRPVAGSNVSIRWNETTDNWELTNDGSTFNAIATDATGDITDVVAGNGLTGGGSSGAVTLTLDTSSSTFVDGAEAIFSVSTAAGSGSGALSYDNTSGLFTFTPADFSSKIALTDLSVTENSASGTGSLSYNNSTGVFTYTPPVLPTGDITGVTAGVGLSGGGTSGDVTVNLDPTITTASASGGGSLAYDNSSGVFTFAPADSVTTATNATNIAITDDTSQDASHYLTFSAATSGNNPLEVSSSKLFFNPSSGTLSVGTSVATSNLDGILNITGSGSSDLIINAKANTIIKEEFSSVNSEIFNVDGKGYAFRENNITAAVETLSASLDSSDAITSYLFNGSVTSGSADITVTSMNDKQGDASVVVADVIKQYMTLTNSWLGTASAPFPVGTYVQSVAGSVVTMSQNAQADYTFSDNVFNPGAVDTATSQTISIISNYAYDGGANTTVKYNQPQNTDAFGYPSTGFTASDFSYSHGSASDYTFSGTQAAYFRGKTDVMPANAFLNVRGLTVGENTTMTARGENDALQSFGISMMWDGVTSTGYDNQIPTILAKAYSDKALQGQLSGFYKQSTGPRLYFQSAYGNANDYALGTYPRANYELGRISFSGTAGDNTTPSTLTPPAYISVQAADDWATQGSVAGNTNLFISGTADRSRGSDIIMAYKGGELILASGKPNAGSQRPVIFAPAQQGGTAPASNYSGDYAQWGTFNYVDETGETGSKLTVTNGGSSGAGTVGNIELSVFRNDVTNGGSNVSVANQYNAVGNNMWNPIGAGAATGKDILLFGSYLSSVDLTGLSDGQIATFDNYTGDVGTEINGNSYYVKIYSYAGSPYFGQYGIELFTDSGLTTAYSFTASSGNYGAGTMEWTVAPSVTDREYKFNLAEQSETLEFNTVTNNTTSTLITYSDNVTDFVSSRVKLEQLTTTQINALSGMTNGEMVYNTTLNQICFYNGSAWQKVDSQAM